MVSQRGVHKLKRNQAAYSIRFGQHLEVILFVYREEPRASEVSKWTYIRTLLTPVANHIPLYESIQTPNHRKI